MYKGVWQGTTLVALKAIKQEFEEEFLREAFLVMYELRNSTALTKSYRSLNHPNIVRCLGLYVAGNSKYMVTGVYLLSLRCCSCVRIEILSEFMAMGSLDVLLRKRKEKVSTEELIKMYDYTLSIVPRAN